MSEKINQMQFDLLLKEVERMERETSNERVVMDYNFLTPNRFSKEKIRLVGNIYENYVRALSSYMSSLMRTPCTIRVSEVKENRYSDFANSFSSRELMAVVKIKEPDHPNIHDSIRIRLSNKFCLFTYVKLLGDGSDRIYSDTAYIGMSSVEGAIIEYFMKQIIPIMEGSLKGYYNSELQYDRIDANPKLSHDVKVNETVVIVELEISIAKFRDKINICLPGEFLDRFFDYVDINSKEFITEEKGNNRDEILQTIEESSLELYSILDTTKLSLGDIYNLQVGDVIQFDKKKDEDVYIYIGETPWFSGSVGTYNNKTVVKVNKTFKYINS